jgi:hypothetical protein
MNENKREVPSLTRKGGHISNFMKMEISNVLKVKHAFRASFVLCTAMCFKKFNHLRPFGRHNAAPRHSANSVREIRK